MPLRRCRRRPSRPLRRDVGAVLLHGSLDTGRAGHGLPRLPAGVVAGSVATVRARRRRRPGRNRLEVRRPQARPRHAPAARSRVGGPRSNPILPSAHRRSLQPEEAMAPKVRVRLRLLRAAAECRRVGHHTTWIAFRTLLRRFAAQAVGALYDAVPGRFDLLVRVHGDEGDMARTAEAVRQTPRVPDPARGVGDMGGDPAGHPADRRAGAAIAGGTTGRLRQRRLRRRPRGYIWWRVGNLPYSSQGRNKYGGGVAAAATATR